MKVTREDVRQKIVLKLEQLKSLWTAFPLAIEYDNLAKVNLATQSEPYICFNIVYQDGNQIGLGYKSGFRVMGTLVLEVKVKEGSGNAKANLLLDHFVSPIHMTDSLVPLRTMASKYASKSAVNGWTTQAALIPFSYDSV